MPPFVALVLCVMFIGWLVLVDVVRRPVSAAVWLPTLWLLILGSRPVSTWFNGGMLMASRGNDSDGSPIDRTFYLAMIVVCWLIAAARRTRWREVFGANRAVLAFYVYFACSVFWSIEPGDSFKRLFKDFGNVFVVAAIMSEREPLEAMRAVFVRCACVLIPLSVLFIKYYPDWGRAYTITGEPMYTGVTTQKNSLGEIVLIFGMFLLWDYLETRTSRNSAASRWPWDRIVLLAMSLWLLNVSQSKTALLCLTTGSGLVLAGEWFSARLLNRTALLLALFMPFVLFSLQQFNSLVAPLVQALGRDLTFTGRTDIWQHVTWDTVNPLFGAGFWVFWGGQGGAAIQDAMQTTIPSAHNGYLDIYLDGGLCALGLVFLLFFSRGTQLIRRAGEHRYYRVRFAVLVAAILYNLSESSMGRLIPLWFTTLAVLLEFPAVAERLALPARVPAAVPRMTAKAQPRVNHAWGSTAS